MLVVVVAAGLADPPGRLVARLAEAIPLVEHPRPAGRRLEPGDVPWLVGEGGQELRVQPVDVDVMALVRAGRDSLELDLGLGEPRPEMADDVPNRPVRVPVIAGDQAL